MHGSQCLKFAHLVYTNEGLKKSCTLYTAWKTAAGKNAVCLPSEHSTSETTFHQKVHYSHNGEETDDSVVQHTWYIHRYLGRYRATGVGRGYQWRNASLDAAAVSYRYQPGQGVTRMLIARPRRPRRRRSIGQPRPGGNWQACLSTWRTGIWPANQPNQTRIYHPGIHRTASALPAQHAYCRYGPEFIFDKRHKTRLSKCKKIDSKLKPEWTAR